MDYFMEPQRRDSIVPGPAHRTVRIAMQDAVRHACLSGDDELQMRVLRHCGLAQLEAARSLIVSQGQGDAYAPKWADLLLDGALAHLGQCMDLLCGRQSAKGLAWDAVDFSGHPNHLDAVRGCAQAAELAGGEPTRQAVMAQDLIRAWEGRVEAEEKELTLDMPAAKPPEPEGEAGAKPKPGEVQERDAAPQDAALLQELLQAWGDLSVRNEAELQEFGAQLRELQEGRPGLRGSIRAVERSLQEHRRRAGVGADAVSVAEAEMIRRPAPV